jgi:GTPase SAR1 family protein
MPASIESSLDTAGLATEQRGLLDLIDKLQFCQLDNVKLPQIVVVGDQSAGKSSVLEALTGTPFPRDAGACTRFATEIRMRRTKEARLSVTIIPDKNRPFEEQNRLRQFGGDVNGDTSFESLMRTAVDQIAPKHIPGRFAARDVLVVEKTGPDMPLLTLVDLPGLVRVANRDQSEADIATIEALSDRYMKSSRTIILAVIGGNNDYVQAPILQKARQFDPKGSRTIGVLTKPDLTEQIGLEDKFIGLVSNQDAENNFKLGWYVLLNPGPPRAGEAWPSAEERRQREDEFFGRGKWSTLPPSMCGISALRQKLSLQLQRHIGRHIKSLRRQIQQALERCERELKAMGSARDTVEEMRQEMGELFSASNHLVTPAVDGTYKNPPGERFFAKESDPRGTPSQKLRARVREESERFSRGFRQNGRKMNFLSSSSPSVQSPTLPEAGSTSNAKRDFARREVEPLLAQSRGNELPLDSNPRAPFILFQDYSANWPTLAQEYKDNLGVLCNEFLADVIDYVWPMRMRDPLRAQFLEPLMKKMMASAEEELGKLQDDMELEIQPFDPEYENRLRQWRADATENGGTYTEAEEVLEKMLIYYELTARIFIRNVVTQVIERHLLLGMLRLFNPVQILGMPNEIIEAIAAENRQMRERRQALKAQRQAIQEAKAICANLAMRSELRTLYDDDQDEDTPSEDEGNGAYARRAPPPVAPRPESTRTRRHRRNSSSNDEAPPLPAAPAPPVPENRPPRPPREPAPQQSAQQPNNPALPPRQPPPIPATPAVTAHDAYSSSPSGSGANNRQSTQLHAQYDDDIAAAQKQSLEEYYASAQAHQQAQQQAMLEYQQAAREREREDKDKKRYRLPRLGN